MNTLSLTRFTRSVAGPADDFRLSPAARAAIGVACIAMSFAVLVALSRAALGMVADLHLFARLPVMIHVAAVLPAIPLGGYVLLAPKGTPRHRLLGKVWLALMLVTAVSAIFIKTGGSFSWIHLFVPLTLHAVWKTIATVRRGDIAGHKRHLVRTYLTALMIPGIAAFLLPGRLMNVMLLG